ncbi:hypothetical protein CCU68_21300 [Pseudomonas gingeri NCPPB 3146 = LMG 5327]|uniref:Uncharacterized protein n=2 Tax=Pseudomonas gingeri TaxID=117681 RepID=A0A7Y7Y1I7_9PSED|nr:MULTISPECIES: hypothetical protein [Pseudomonas]NVZ60458.1 hypothetical protein [Pseudomonas gingeri]NVZ74219.1 hypothetical protein [Pseudomonas gingeri]NWC16247.1 hypothetical protein [Pseudomonas gingeri]NWE71967.1 hypothetical protein [Pseudomonas gingeri]PNQ90549.1 hypothetical protein CCU68_21300 [Pseudomonas gingeri NCPPB 3146 = LMG 5327]
MPYRPPPRRRLYVTLNPLQLTASIALGIWLGFVALALTAWLVARLFIAQPLAPVAEAVRQISQPAAPTAPQAPGDSTQMFEQYKENLRKNEEQQRLDQARNSYRNLSNPKCQFWLQQDQTAPSDKSRANVLQFCN